MAVFRQCFLAVTLLLIAAQRLSGATAETRDFNAAANAFGDGFYDWAEGKFGEFARKYPNSARLPEAILYRAEAQVRLTNYAGAIELLTDRQNQAGQWADEYLFWLGQAHFYQADFQAAADAFARLVKEFPA